MIFRFLVAALCLAGGSASAQVTLLTPYGGSLTTAEQTKLTAITGTPNVVSATVYTVTANALYQTMLDIPIQGALRRFTGSSSTIDGVLTWQTPATATDLAVVTDFGGALGGHIRYGDKVYTLHYLGTRAALVEKAVAPVFEDEKTDAEMRDYTRTRGHP